MKTSEETNSQLLQRNEEIKQLIESIRPKALINIEKAQIQQKKTQNNDYNVSETPLEPHTKVMVKSLKLVPAKLAPKYSGPFQVDSRTPQGNYYLRYRTKKLLDAAVQKSRLKQVSKNINDDPFLGIDKIIKDRVRNGIKEYFVKWQNYPASESSWVPDQIFQIWNALKITITSKIVDQINK